MRLLFSSLLTLALLGGCACKNFDKASYERQNEAAEKSLNSL